MTIQQIYNNLPRAAKQISPKVKFLKTIAQTAKCSEATVRMWISGRQKPDELAKSAISLKLGIPANELFDF